MRVAIDGITVTEKGLASVIEKVKDIISIAETGCVIELSNVSFYVPAAPISIDQLVDVD